MTTSSSTNYKSSIGQFQLGIYLTHFQVNKHGMVDFKSFFFQHHIRDRIFSTFSTNLHAICFQLN
jgi:hypothetical protein